MLYPRKLKLLTAFAAVLAVLAFILPPVTYLALKYQHEKAVVSVETHVNALAVSELINTNPELWVFEQLRLIELLSFRTGSVGASESRTVYDIEGTIVAQSKGVVDAPRISSSRLLFDAGRPVGRIDIERSFRVALINSGGIAAISLVVALLLFLATYGLPLRTLRKTFNDLRQEKEKALVTLQSIGDAVITTDQNMRIEYLNPVAEELTGWTTAEARSMHMDEVFRIFNEKSREPSVNPIRECLDTNAVVAMENHTILVRKGDGEEFHIEDSAAPIRLSDGVIVGAVMVFHDVTDRRKAQKRLHHIAFHDELTGLPNRSYFQESLRRAMQEAHVLNRQVGVLFMDLDRFKTVNDSLGHAVGDELLILVAKRLQACVRDHDMVSRMGGDEFTAVLTDLPSAESAAIVAEKIIKALSAPFQLHGNTLRISASIGITLFPRDGASIGILLKNADTAMYHAKSCGRNNFQYYTAAMSARAVDALYLENALRTALENAEYYLEYQPKFDVKTRRVVGVEALLRWNSPHLGCVMPSDFISALEESGDICQVGNWVLKTAIAQAKVWMDAGRALVVSVNVSARQFKQPDWVGEVMALLDAAGLPPSLLQIEVTESLLMDGADRNETMIRTLTHLGVKVALDDFGTGFSSLSYLCRFPITELKIDRSFVVDIRRNTTAYKVVKTIIELGQALDIRVIAEGVETPEQYDLLTEMGCDEIQGYLVSRPLGVVALEAFLDNFGGARRAGPNRPPLTPAFPGNLPAHT